jgi:hypothetical protein
MNVSLELRNEANGVYGRQPEDRYQRLLLVGADHIDDLEKRIELLRSLINAWADAEDEADMIRGVDLFIAYQALRKAVGR